MTDAAVNTKVDGLDAFQTHDLVAEMERRGFDIYDLDVITGDGLEIERLADAIAAGQTRDALELLRELTPNAPEPATTLYLRDLRASQSEA